MATPTPRKDDTWLPALRDPNAREATLTELGRYLRAALARAVGNRPGVDSADLDDYTQDALLRIVQGLDRFRGDSRFTTWATAIAIRAAFDALRRRRARQLSLDELSLELEPATDPAGVAPGADLEQRELVGALRAAIENALTPRQREAVLGELAGVPTVVLAERLGTNTNALYKLHHDARKKLRAALAAAGFSDEDVRRSLLEATETR